MNTRLPSIAVTGATGWIGRRLCDVAARRGHAVRPIARQALQSVDACAAALAGCDVLVHLAAVVHRAPGGVPDRLHEDVTVGITGLLAAAARQASLRRFVFVSTAKVMGERTDRPALESDPPAPADAYARSKLAAEGLLARPGAGRSFEVVVVRPPLVYGPGVSANFLALMRLADNPWPLPFAGALGPRSMVFIDNLVDALLFVSCAQEAAGRIFFVTDGADVTVAALTHRLRRGLGRPARLFHLSRPLLDAGARVAAQFGVNAPSFLQRLFEPLQIDASALRSIGWRPPIDPEAALEATLDWYRSR